MANNDDLALKLKAAAEKAQAALTSETISRDEILRAADGLSVTASPANILSLLAERTADKAENASLRQRVAELETVCAESYQVVGALANAAGVFETSEAVSKALDNLSEAKLVHSDVLPFSVGSRAVKLPKTMYAEFDDDDYCREVPVLDKQQVIDALATAGIKLEVEE